MPQEDCICAIATAAGDAALAIVRLSGQGAKDVAEAVLRRRRGDAWQPLRFRQGWRMRHGWVWEPDGQGPVDEVLACWFPAPRSFTGEEMVELTCHGGREAARGVLSALLRAGARPAEPGEFSRRAFVNGRLDLTQAEAIMDLIQAGSVRGRQVAARQLAGDVGDEARRLSAQVLGLLAEVEARLDFPEDDLGDVDRTRLQDGIAAVAADVAALLGTSHGGRFLREGAHVVLIGQPNAGKSSLLNRLAGRERAIVSPEAGTTRDYLEETIVLGGVPVTLVDTAGLRAAETSIEAAGVARAQSLAETADLLLCVVPGHEPLADEDEQAIRLCSGRDAVIVMNKSDLGRHPDVAARIAAIAPGVPVLSVSALTGAGVAELRQWLADWCGRGLESDVVITNTRHIQALQRAHDSLGAALAAVEQGLEPEFVAVDLREARQALGELTGETASEDVINEIFSRFCIGK